MNNGIILESVRQSVEDACTPLRENLEHYLEKRVKTFLTVKLNEEDFHNFKREIFSFYPLTVISASTPIEIQDKYIEILRDWGFKAQFSNISPDWLRLEFKLESPIFGFSASSNTKAYEIITEVQDAISKEHAQNWWLANKFWSDVVIRLNSMDYSIDPDLEAIVMYFYSEPFHVSLFTPKRFNLFTSLATSAGFSACWYSRNALYLKI